LPIRLSTRRCSARVDRAIQFRNGYVTFGCFNRHAKISDDAISPVVARSRKCSGRVSTFVLQRTAVRVR
jgi:hypothetical protein